MKCVIVVERLGVPIVQNLTVEAYPDSRMAEARMEVTPLVRLQSEKLVPYVSVETLEAFIRQHGADPELEALIAEARTGLYVDDSGPLYSLNDGPPYALSPFVHADAGSMFERACLNGLKVGETLMAHTVSQKRAIKRVR